MQENKKKERVELRLTKETGIYVLEKRRIPLLTVDLSNFAKS